jgi:hypothetical protein
MRSVVHNPLGANVRAYIVDGHDASGELVYFGGTGQHLTLVDNPAEADITIRVASGPNGRLLSAVEARAAAAGHAAAVAPPPRRSRWRRWLVAGCVLWLGMVIAVSAAGKLAAGPAVLMFLLTPVFGPVAGVFLRLFASVLR